MENNRSFFFDEDNNPKPNPFVDKEGKILSGKYPHRVSFIRMQNLYRMNTPQKEIDEIWDLIKQRLEFYDKHFKAQKAQ